MKDRDGSSLDAKEEKISIDKGTYKKKNTKILWVVLVVLVVGLISFVVANNDIFHLSTPSTTSCGTVRSSSANSIQYGASAYYNNSCRTQTREQQEEKRWQDILEASPVVIAVASAVTSLSLIILTWQVSKLVNTLSKRREN
jgi:hypothetical protein